MNHIGLMMTRKSVRTFDGRALSEDDLNDLRKFAKNVENPYGIPVEFVFLDAEGHGLSSKVIAGERLYVAGKVVKQPHCEEAFGYSFERFVLHAWERGVGTTWIGGTLDRELFERAAKTLPEERMYIASPLGYPAETRSEVDEKLRAGVNGDERKPEGELFFDGDFGTPLDMASCGLADALQAVRWAPSAANNQPCRVVRAGGAFHFYVEHKPGYGGEPYGDVQKIDLGIALCHFVTATGGAVSLTDPGVGAPEGVEYIATVTV